jgi:hypothetical protein
MAIANSTGWMMTPLAVAMTRRMMPRIRSMDHSYRRGMLHKLQASALAAWIRCSNPAVAQRRPGRPVDARAREDAGACALPRREPGGEGGEEVTLAMGSADSWRARLHHELDRAPWARLPAAGWLRPAGGTPSINRRP